MHYLIIAVLLFSPWAYANNDADQLARAGAQGLALQKLESQLLDTTVGDIAWSSLKRKQVAIMRNGGRYADLAALLAQDIQANSNPATRRWLQNQQVQAYLEAGLPHQAIDQLRRALWQNADSYKPEVLDAVANWRRQLVEARVLAGQYDLAADTLARYESDYQIESDVGALKQGIQRWPWQYQPRFNQELKRSRAHLFLKSGEFDIPAQLLKNDEHRSVQLVRLLSLLRTGGMAPSAVYAEAVAIAQDKAQGLPTRKSAWVLASEAALYVGDPVAEVQAIKKAMTMGVDLPFSESLLALTVRESWVRLETVGERLMRNWPHGISRQAALSKLGAAGFALEKVQGVLAQLYTRSDKTTGQSPLLNAMINLETDERVRRELLPAWLLQNERVNAKTFSPTLNYQLTELLLKNGDIPAAADLMAQLNSAPADVSAVEWQLRRARVLVLAAKADQGVAVMHQLLDGVYGSQPDIDRFLQAVFDVQAVGANSDAIALYQRLLGRDLDDRQRRELHYWLADAAKANEDHLLAAEQYLLSAGERTNSWDPWGVSARRQAAESLKTAGLLQDAINIYQRLFDRSKDRTERAVLRTNIQRLKAQL